jgi:D-glycero-alpha-D-manno-heptose-7-phosphate kinase
MIIAKAPFRLYFAGGATDLAQYYEKYGGSVINVAIDKYVYSTIKPRNDNKFSIFSANLDVSKKADSFDELSIDGTLDIPIAVIKHFKSRKGIDLLIKTNIPAGSGLGGSSSVCVSLIKAISKFNSITLSKEEIAEIAYKIRIEDLKFPTGKQDEYAAAFGGLNLITFDKSGKANIEPLKVPKNTLDILQNNLMLFFLGKTRTSTNILRSMEKYMTEEKPEVISALHKAKDLTVDVKKALEEGDLKQFAKLLSESWRNKRNLDKEVTNKFIDDVYTLGIKEGALGGMLMGAGAGGYMLFYVEPDKQQHIRKVMEKKGLNELHFRFDFEGATIIKEEI